MNKKTPFLILIIFFLTFYNVMPMESKINIISDKLNIDMDQRKSTFTGNVYAQNAKLKVWSERMIIKLKLNKDEIKEIVASGNVKIIRIIDGSEMYGDAANYSLEEEVVIITGNVKVKEKGNEISGNKLVVDLENSSSIMSGSDTNRVEALILSN